jgi:phosphopantetheinyl transferase (holo-ACP synthase)
MLHRNCSLGLIIVVVQLCCGAMANAQPGGARGIFLGGGVFIPLIPLAGMGPVQKDLSLEGDALANVGRIDRTFHEEVNAESSDLRNLSPEEFSAARQKNAEIRRRLNDKFAPQLKEALTPAQFERLQQIQWQLAEIQTLTNPDLAARLDLTTEQQEKITAIKKDYEGKMQELAGRGRGGDREEIRTKRQQLLKECYSKAIDVLTKDQQERNTKLKGKPFDVTSVGPARQRGGQ